MDSTITTTTKTNSVANIAQENELSHQMFILLAEYLGYVSPLVEWAEEWFNNKDGKFPEYKKHILRIEAKNLYYEMTNDDVLDDAKNWYDKLKDLIFPINDDDLPF